MPPYALPLLEICTIWHYEPFKLDLAAVHATLAPDAMEVNVACAV